MASGCTQIGSETEITTDTADELRQVAAMGGYAEMVYNSYQEAAGDRVSFSVTPLASGPLSAVAGISVNDTLAVPDYWLRMEPRGTEITDLYFEQRDPATDEWRQAIDLAEFDALGHPVELGTYRLLSIGLDYQSTSVEYLALEACWQSDGYCIVMDPVVLQLDAYAETRRELLAEGWAPVVEFDQGSEVQGSEVGIESVCALNGYPGSGWVKITYSSYTVKYKNVFGMTLVQKNMGGQQAGVSCYVSGSSCRSSGFGYSNSSSCSATLGYNCDCDNTGNQNGSTQPATRSWSQSKCTHKFSGSASVSWSRNGSGASFSISWNTNGSVDSIGGTIYDSCSWQ